MQRRHSSATAVATTVSAASAAAHKLLKGQCILPFEEYCISLFLYH